MTLAAQELGFEGRVVNALLELQKNTQIRSLLSVVYQAKDEINVPIALSLSAICAPIYISRFNAHHFI